ncbi:MAG: Ig-like domain-containing protein [Bacteroidota bacterium]
MQRILPPGPPDESVQALQRAGETRFNLPLWKGAEGGILCRTYSLTRLLACFLLALFLTNCANPIAPTGGPKDEDPPKLDLENSTQNRQVRFEKKDIVLAFNEWVQLKDAFNQVVVSPPLEFRPTIERRKKTIQFKFDEREALRDSATYVINFGDAIQDLTEGNVAKVVFVFSTGDYIDSLSVKGTIIDARTSEPVADVLFMLYENLADSVFRTERPFYFSKTDEKGKFNVENIKEGRFKAVALDDNNLNYRFDSETEKIAFLDSAIYIKGVEKVKTKSLQPPADSLMLDSLTIDSLVIDTLTADSAQIDSLPPDSLNNQQSAIINDQPLLLRLFQEEPALYLRDDDARTYGQVKLAFNTEPQKVEVTYDSIGLYTFLEQEKDTIYLWYAMEADAAFNVYVKRDTVVDTVEVKSGLKDKFFEKAALVAKGKAPTRLPILMPGSDFTMLFNHPLYAINDTLTNLLEDSLKTAVTGRFSIDSVNFRKININAAWQEGLRYEAEFLPGSLTDIFGLQNTDTLRRAWIAGSASEFGSLTLRVTGFSPDTTYLIRLLANNDEVVDTFHVKGDSIFETKMEFLLPDVYRIEIIEDLNGDGRWTTGSYDDKRQPEKVQEATLEEVRANWEVSAEVPFNRQIIVRSTDSPGGSSGGGGVPSRNPGSGGPPGNRGQ